MTALAEPGTTAAPEPRPLKGLARTAARRMVKAWEAPVFHLTVEVDMGAALSAKGGGVTVTDLLVQACAVALKAHPAVNAHYDDEAVTVFGDVNVGIAVATDAGLMVPVIHGADRLDVPGLAAARRDVVARANAGELKMPDVTGGTFTVSNLGMLGIDEFDAILNVPQVAILAVGATRDVPVLVDGATAWRPKARFTLTCDHRALDGATGARFLATLREALESVA
jgi:pyruvate dehydrogenase E2 component (dihydrolipoamide acetyltransferase)